MESTVAMAVDVLSQTERARSYPHEYPRLSVDLVDQDPQVKSVCLVVAHEENWAAALGGVLGEVVQAGFDFCGKIEVASGKHRDQ